MTIKTFDFVSGYLYAQEWHECEKRISDIDDLKHIMKKLISGMKKNNGYNNLSFQIISDAGYYIAVEKYDADAEAFKTIFYERWNIKDNPTMKSAKNLTAWAIDVFKSDESEKQSA